MRLNFVFIFYCIFCCASGNLDFDRYLNRYLNIECISIVIQILNV